MAKITQVERGALARQRCTDRAAMAAARPKPVAPGRCFTAVDPAGTMLVKFTRLSRRGVQRAIAGHLAGYDDTACQNWPRARQAGWRVVPVTMAPVSP